MYDEFSDKGAHSAEWFEILKDWRRRPEGVNGSQSKFLIGTWPIS
jgi:hypothetical protein